MTRRKKDPLRPLTSEERTYLDKVSRSRSEPATSVQRAKAILAVTSGNNYTAAARQVGLCCGDTVSQWVRRFNIEGLSALLPHHGGGSVPQYTEVEKQRILAQVQRVPDRQIDGTATWSITTLQRTLRQAPDGLPAVSTYMIWQVLQEAGYSWQRTRTWCHSGGVKRIRKHRLVIVNDPDAEAKKNL